jgi:ParB-like chromosome segregation protein Spo0J
MQVQTVALAALKAPAQNARVHPEAQIVELVRAIAMFGQTRPILIDEAWTVLAGNGLVLALRRLERETAQVLIMPGLSAAQKTKLMLSDNKIFTLGHDDYDSIMAMIKGLDDLDIPGFDDKRLSVLFADEAALGDSLDGFGLMSPEEKAARQKAAGGLDRPAAPTVLICPHCDKSFAVK